MSGVHGQVFGHLVRRGMSAAQVHLSEAGNPGSEPEKDVVMTFDPQEYLPVMIVVVITALLIASVCESATRTIGGASTNKPHRSATRSAK